MGRFHDILYPVWLTLLQGRECYAIPWLLPITNRFN